MYLTLSKRFEFAASHLCRLPGVDQRDNYNLYGNEARGNHGHGHNFIAHTVFHGPVDDQTGMMLNVSDIKREVNAVLAERYDHKYLNRDHPSFTHTPPTVELIARELLSDTIDRFQGNSARPVVGHVALSEMADAVAYRGGRVERNEYMTFSAARRTFSPRLSDGKNRKLFGSASKKGGHGHGYRLRLTLAGALDEKTGLLVPHEHLSHRLSQLHNRLDHRNLNRELSDYGDRPMTTECLSQYIFEKLVDDLPLVRVRLAENDNFFVEYQDDGNYCLGLRQSFYAAHRLHSPQLPDSDNREIYGKCNNPAGHGHQYLVEATFTGSLDDKSGTLYPLDQLNAQLSKSLDAYNYKHLDLDTDDFKDSPSTGEMIVRRLWERIERDVPAQLCRLRLWETPNNRFTLRPGDAVERATTT